MSSAVSRHDEMLEEPRREHHEELEAWVRELCALLTPNDAVNEIESLSDDRSGGGIGEALLEITDSTEPIVLSIGGRDRRLHVR
jgi:hypothetical protein